MVEQPERSDRSHWAKPNERQEEPVSDVYPVVPTTTMLLTTAIPAAERRRLRAAGKRVPKDLFAFLTKLDARLVVVLGSLAVGMGPLLTKMSGENAATTIFFRFSIALIPLAIFAVLEWRLNGRMRWKGMAMHLLAGVFFGLDVGLFIPGVYLAGAGIATVAGNLQVIIVPLMALLFFRERMARPFVIAIPFMLAGVVLLSGALEQGSFSGQVFLGVMLAVGGGFAYAGYVMVIARARPTGHACTQVFLSTASAMVVGTLVAMPFGAPNYTPPLDHLLVLIALALLAQVIGWIATSSALPRVDGTTGPMLLLIQPLVAVVGGVVFLAEQISVLQWLGIAIVIAAIGFTTVANARRAAANR
ncbi:DMT family transporter [Gulosibacter sp. ACHW.36C]|uniref:DMT family transporter n=1 Tax=Gulosibacter sediminis TaxID=1729695 RepID=A0ABY4N0L2_9MICO|nr:DMT family transporter [Gulosibacter sediminis]UQN14977.1 DMT family transporter [Gulosibacter sediminis]